MFISADSDIESVCAANPSFHYLSGVAEFLDLFNKHEKKLTRRVRMILKRKMNEIEADVRERFEMSGFVLTGEQGEVEHVEVERIRLDKT